MRHVHILYSCEQNATVVKEITNVSKVRKNTIYSGSLSPVRNSFAVLGVLSRQAVSVMEFNIVDSDTDFVFSFSKLLFGLQHLLLFRHPLLLRVTPSLELLNIDYGVRYSHVPAALWFDGNIIYISGGVQSCLAFEHVAGESSTSSEFALL